MEAFSVRDYGTINWSMPSVRWQPWKQCPEWNFKSVAHRIAMHLIPLMASQGVLNPNPMDFQKRFTPFPGLFPFRVFFQLRKGPKTTNDSASKHHNAKNKNKKKKWSIFLNTKCTCGSLFWDLVSHLNDIVPGDFGGRKRWQCLIQNLTGRLWRRFKWWYWQQNFSP